MTLLLQIQPEVISPFSPLAIIINSSTSNINRRHMTLKCGGVAHGDANSGLCFAGDSQGGPLGMHSASTTSLQNTHEEGMMNGSGGFAHHLAHVQTALKAESADDTAQALGIVPMTATILRLCIRLLAACGLACFQQPYVGSFDTPHPHLICLSHACCIVWGPASSCGYCVLVFSKYRQE